MKESDFSFLLETGCHLKKKILRLFMGLEVFVSFNFRKSHLYSL